MESSNIIGTYTGIQYTYKLYSIKLKKNTWICIEILCEYL
jgi:hypothetical protein